MGLESGRREHLLVGVRRRRRRRGRGQWVLGAVDGAHARDVLVVGRVEVVDGGQRALVPHEREAPADVSRDPLVRMSVSMRMMRKLVGHGGDGG